MNLKLTFAFFFLTTVLFAQNENSEKFKITGTVCEQTLQALEYVSVVLVPSDNTKDLTGSVSDDKGHFEIIASPGKYTLEISMIGYEKYHSELELTNDLNIGSIILATAIQKLKEVEITSQPIVRNAEGFSVMVSSSKTYEGLDLFDVLRTAPGIWSSDNALNVYGNNVSKVYINDREVKLSGSELLNYLRMYDHKNIRKIDIILNSGAEEDAQSAGGSILKITTNKIDDGGNLRIGLNTNISSMAQFFTPLGNLNLRQGRFSEYIITSYPIGRSDKTQNSGTLFYQTGNLSEQTMNFNSQVNYNIPITTLGVGYDINPRNVITFETVVKKFQFNNSREKSTIITHEDVFLESNASSFSSKNMNKSYNISANYIYLPQNEGKLIFRADYLYNNTYYRDNDSTIYSPSSTILTNNTDSTSRRLYSFSVDYTKPLRGKKDLLSAGGKYYQAKNQTDMSHYNYPNTVTPTDDSYADRFNYRESVLAAYVKYNLILEKLKVLAGVRMEASQIHPESKLFPENNHKSKYIDLFPSLSVTYDWNKKTYSTLRYSSSITRPNFTDLNPGITSRDNFFYNVGNSYLKPSYRKSINFETFFLQNYALTMGYFTSKDLIISNTFQDSISTMLYSQQQNMASSEGWSVGANGTFKITKWLTVNAGIIYRQATVQYPDTIYPDNKILVLANTNITLPKGFRLMGNLSSNTINSGNFKQDGKAIVSLSLYKNFLNNKLSVNIGVSDLFSANIKSHKEYYSPTFYQYVHSTNRNSTRFSINVAYNFKWGNKFVKINRTEAGNQEEQSRTVEKQD